MRPMARDPPRLIALGNIEDDSLSIHCYVDTEPFFAVKDPIEAMLLLLSSYFVLPIEWNTHTRLPLIMLCCCTVGSAKVREYVARNNKLQDLLSRLKLL